MKLHANCQNMVILNINKAALAARIRLSWWQHQTAEEMTSKHKVLTEEDWVAALKILDGQKWKQKITHFIDAYLALGYVNLFLFWLVLAMPWGKF